MRVAIIALKAQGMLEEAAENLGDASKGKRGDFSAAAFIVTVAIWKSLGAAMASRRCQNVITPI
jgi:hypothetical protein